MPTERVGCPQEHLPPGREARGGGGRGAREGGAGMSRPDTSSPRPGFSPAPGASASGGSGGPQSAGPSPAVRLRHVTSPLCPRFPSGAGMGDGAVQGPRGRRGRQLTGCPCSAGGARVPGAPAAAASLPSGHAPADGRPPPLRGGGAPRARSLASSLCSRGHLFSTRPPSPGRPSLVPRDQPFAPGSFGPVTPSAEQLAHALPAPRCPFGRSYFGKTAPASPSAARREASSAPSEAAHLSLSVPLCLPRPRPRRSVTG